MRPLRVRLMLQRVGVEAEHIAEVDDLIVKVTVDMENVALGDVISTADLH